MVRVPLSDLQKPKQLASAPAKQKEPTPQTKVLVQKRVPTTLATTAPVKEIFVDQAISQMNPFANKKKTLAPKVQHTWDESDHISPLSEILEEYEKEHPDEFISRTSPKRDEQVQKVVESLSFSLDKDLFERLRLLIESRLKDIRTDLQVEDYATRLKENGGLGLSQEQSRELIEQIREVYHLKVKKEIPKIPLPSVRPSPTSTPKEPQIHHTKNYTKNESGKPLIEDVKSAPLPKIEQHGIHPVGPVEEFGTLSLVEFRRLNTDPVKAAERLKEKIQSIKDESFLLFVEAVRAWHRSELYSTYQSALVGALGAGEPLEQYLLKNQSGLSSAEFGAVLSFEKSIR